MEKQIELMQAQQETAVSLTRFRNILDELDRRVSVLVNKLEVPERLARHHPAINAAIFAAIGFVVGTRIKPIVRPG